MKNQFKVRSLLFITMFIALTAVIITINFSKTEEVIITVKDKYYEWEIGNEGELEHNYYVVSSKGDHYYIMGFIPSSSYKNLKVGRKYILHLNIYGAVINYQQI